MAVTTVSDLNGLFNTIYERALFVAREVNLMTNLVDVRGAAGWMDRNISTRPAVSAVSVGESQDYNSPTTFGKSTKATLTPDEIIAQATLTDRDMETDPDGAQADAETELGGAIATKIDVDLLADFGSFTTDKGDGAGNAFTLDNWAAGIAVLGNNKAMQYGMPVSVLHPYHWHDLWLELGKPTTNVVASDIANEALRNYRVNVINNVQIYTSANIAVDASDDAVSAAFVRPALMLDVRRDMRMEPERDASARAWELNMTAGYAHGVARNEFGVKYTADATEPA
ncbi:hypothetical protein KC887_01225 [Candidatus Kaiserbacteria bacterium]|nr:hypothetical protein [Candidatus Kaiserbacteria bacterium]